MMTYDQLAIGQVFHFKPDACAWEYRGNGFFSRPWSGGPYYIEEPQRTTVEVIPIPDSIGRCPRCGAVAGEYGCSVANNTSACTYGKAVS